MRAGLLVRFGRLSSRRKRLLVRAAALLTVASASIALLPFRMAIRFGSVPLGHARLASMEEAVWAVEAAARRLPWRTMCFEKGTVVQRMLRSSGVEAMLHYGARHDGLTGKLEAHVWVSVGAAIVIGGDEASSFREIATFP